MLVLLVSLATVLYACSPLGRENEAKAKRVEKQLRISVPEDIDYENVFDDVLAKYGTYELQAVETSGMGSVFQLRYSMKMKDNASSKQMIDELRCLNGNLKISLNMMPTQKKEL